MFFQIYETMIFLLFMKDRLVKMVNVVDLIIRGEVSAVFQLSLVVQVVPVEAKLCNFKP